MAGSVIFTNNALKKMKDLGVSEARAVEVYSLGEHRPYHDNMTAQKKYPGYEMGVYYTKDTRTGQPLIISVWKRNNRR